MYINKIKITYDCYDPEKKNVNIFSYFLLGLFLYIILSFFITELGSYFFVLCFFFSIYLWAFPCYIRK